MEIWQFQVSIYTVIDRGRHLRSIFLHKIDTDLLYKPCDIVADDPPHSTDGGVCNANKFTIEAQELLVAMRQFTMSLVHTKRPSPGNLDLDKPHHVSSQCSSPTVDDDDSDVMENIESDLSKDEQVEEWDGHNNFIIPGSC